MALVLTRRQGETIVIGGMIVVTVDEKSEGHVRLLIEAPKNVSVHRLEIFNRIRCESGKVPLVSRDELKRFVEGEIT